MLCLGLQAAACERAVLHTGLGQFPLLAVLNFSDREKHLVRSGVGQLAHWLQKAKEDHC